MPEGTTQKALEFRCQRLEGKEEDRFLFTSTSPAMASVNQSLGHLRRESMKGSPERAVFISGPIGAGHEGVARMIRASSRRAAKPWVVLNCAEMDPAGLRTELFGSESQVGLLESAQGGTLFLKEVYALHTDIQAELASFLMDGKYKRTGVQERVSSDVRLIASHHTNNQSLESRIHPEFLRLLSETQITMPSLKERKEDILPLAQQFAHKVFQEHGKHFEGFKPDAERVLLGRSWPGNLEELYLVISRTALLWSQKGSVAVDGLSDGFGLGARLANITPSAEALRLVPKVDLSTESEINYTAMKKKWSDAFESEYLKETLRRNEGNVSAAAREAKLDRSNFLRLLRRHSLNAESFRKTNDKTEQAAPVRQIA